MEEDPAFVFGSRHFRTKPKKAGKKADVGMIWWLDGHPGLGAS
jgi:hypothetical protein